VPYAVASRSLRSTTLSAHHCTDLVRVNNPRKVRCLARHLSPGRQCRTLQHRFSRSCLQGISLRCGLTKRTPCSRSRPSVRAGVAHPGRKKHARFVFCAADITRENHKGISDCGRRLLSLKHGGCYSSDEPQQLAVCRLNSLRRKAIRLAFQHIVQDFAFLFSRNQTESLSHY